MRLNEVPGQARAWVVLPFRHESDASRRPVKMAGWIGGCAFALPLVVACITNAIANSPTSNAPGVFAMFELFAVSVIVAAGMCSSTIMKRPEPIGQRLVLVAAVWSVLLIETWCIVQWLMRGLH